MLPIFFFFLNTDLHPAGFFFISSQAMAPKIMCTCPCGRLVTHKTNRHHLQGFGTVAVKLAQQRKLLDLRRLHLRGRAHRNQSGSSASGTPSHSLHPRISSDVQMQEGRHVPLRVPEDDPIDTFIKDPASPDAALIPDSPDPDSDVENYQGPATTTFLTDDAPDAHEPRISPDREIRILQRSRVWPAHGAPAFQPTIDELDAGWLADKTDSDHGDHHGDKFLRQFDDDDDNDNDDDRDIPTNEEHSSQPQGMSALDELELNFERTVVASGMYSPSDQCTMDLTWV